MTDFYNFLSPEPSDPATLGSAPRQAVPTARQRLSQAEVPFTDWGTNTDCTPNPSRLSESSEGGDFNATYNDLYTTVNGFVSPSQPIVNIGYPNIQTTEDVANIEPEKLLAYIKASRNNQQVAFMNMVDIKAQANAEQEADQKTGTLKLFAAGAAALAFGAVAFALTRNPGTAGRAAAQGVTGVTAVAAKSGIWSALGGGTLGGLVGLAGGGQLIDGTLREALVDGAKQKELITAFNADRKDNETLDGSPAFGETSL